MQVIDVRLRRLGVGEIMSTRLASHHALLGQWQDTGLACSDISATNGAASVAFVCCRSVVVDGPKKWIQSAMR